MFTILSFFFPSCISFFLLSFFTLVPLQLLLYMGSLHSFSQTSKVFGILTTFTEWRFCWMDMNSAPQEDLADGLQRTTLDSTPTKTQFVSEKSTETLYTLYSTNNTRVLSYIRTLACSKYLFLYYIHTITSGN